MSIDYRDMKKGKPSDPSPEKTDPAAEVVEWWEDESERRGNTFVATAQSLAEDQEYRAQMNLLHARLYGNVEIMGFGLRDYARSGSTPGAQYVPRVNFNVVASAVDALHAKITKSKPRPSFQTDGGTWKMQQKARRLDKFMRGVFYETKLYRKASDAFRESEVFGTSGVKLVPDKKKRVRFERVFIDEIFVDDADAIYGEPTQLFQRKRMHRNVVKKLAGNDVDKLAAVLGAKPPVDSPSLKGFADMIEVWEGWHLPDEDGKGGLHIIAINGCELFCEEWKLKCFPFVWMKLFPRLLGFFGQGAAERLTGIQLEMNRLSRSISEQLRRKGRGRTFVRKGSGITPAHITNAIQDIVQTNGDPRESVLVDNINAVAPEEFMQLKELYARAFQEIGLSELSVSAKKPSGLDAAVALREYNDIETERFVKPAQSYEEFFLDSAELVIEYLRAFGGSGYKVKVPSRRFTMEIDWADIDLDRDSYVMQMFPVSSLPQTPGAKYQRVEEMRRDGYVDMATARRLMDMPDIEAEEDLGNAAMDDVDATIGYVLDEDKPKLYPPEPYQNLQLLLMRTNAAYLFAKHHGCDEERLQMLRDLMDMTSKMLVPPPQPTAPMAAGPGGPAPAPSLAAPSPLLTGGINVDVNTGSKPQPVSPPVTG
jgi:hypothetical protein